MASRRMLPTRFFKDPDIMALSNNDVRLILVGLVLYADDEGRELAHTKLLGREFDYSPEVIEQALLELEANDLISCYVVGKHRYYSLCRWHEWETLSKPTPSKYPAPPRELFSADSGEAPIPQEFPPVSRGDSTEEKGKGNQEGEANLRIEGELEAPDDEKMTQMVHEMPPVSPSNVVVFPLARSMKMPSGTTSIAGIAEEQVAIVTGQVADILKLPPDAALRRIVEEYAGDSHMSLLGEADSAREYIDDARRNHRKTVMSPTFFRRWLKREREAVRLRGGSLPALAATGTDSGSHRETSSGGSMVRKAGMPPSLMNLQREYEQAIRAAHGTTERSER